MSTADTAFVEKQHRIRILMCRDCRTMQTVDYFDGDPDNDLPLKAAIEPHRFPNGEQHVADGLAVVDKRLWDDSTWREAIVAQLNERSASGLGEEYYSFVDTFKDDALKCYSKHGRPEKCHEFHADKKKLSPGTNKARKKAGLGKFSPVKDRYLCDFCPQKAVYDAAQMDNGVTDID